MTRMPSPFARAAWALSPLLLGVAASAAHAQSSVTLYGIVDAYAEYRTDSNANGDARWNLNSGGMNTSRWGMRGTEDLGGGLKALFQLESEIQVDTGAGGSALFGRQANVGLEGTYGRLLLGRSYSTAYDFLLPFDPMGYAPNYSWATSAGATGGRADGMITGVSNLVKYRGEFGPFKVGASYGFGETSDDIKDNATAIVAVSYNAGPLGLVVVADQRNSTQAADGQKLGTRTYHLGASYEIGPVELFAVGRDYSRGFSGGGADNDSRTYWVGAVYKATSALTLTAAYYAQDIRSSNGPTTIEDPSLIVLRARQALSKRTSLYATLGHARADEGTVGVSRDDVGFDDTQSGLSVGIQHRF